MTVRIYHLRNKDENTGAIDNKGGVTIALQLNDNLKVEKAAFAYCHENDNFNKKLGTIKATGRLKSKGALVMATPLSIAEFFDWMSTLDTMEE